MIEPSKMDSVRLASPSTGRDYREAVVQGVNRSQRTVTLAVWSCPHGDFDWCLRADIEVFHGVPWSLLRS